MADTHKVRLVIQPTEEIEVSSAELANLTSQGLVLKTTATTDAGARKAAEKQVAASAATEDKKD